MPSPTGLHRPVSDASAVFTPIQGKRRVADRATRTCPAPADVDIRVVALFLIRSFTMPARPHPKKPSTRVDRAFLATDPNLIRVLEEERKRSSENDRNAPSTQARRGRVKDNFLRMHAEIPSFRRFVGHEFEEDSILGVSNFHGVLPLAEPECRQIVRKIS
jgi:hypothetical protein